MNDVQSSEHRSVDELLPWYVNKTLDDRERARVKRHIAACTNCQENVRLWSQVQSAVRDRSPVPFVPEPNADALLHSIEKDERGWSPDNARMLYGVAASLLVIIAVAVVFMTRDPLTPDTPAEFETVISESADDTVRYVIELRFDQTAKPEQRKEIMGALGDVTLDVPLEAEVITLHLAAASLPELQQRMNDVRALPTVVDARIVAVHLPVD